MPQTCNDIVLVDATTVSLIDATTIELFCTATGGGGPNRRYSQADLDRMAWEEQLQVLLREDEEILLCL